MYYRTTREITTEDWPFLLASIPKNTILEQFNGCVSWAARAEEVIRSREGVDFKLIGSMTVVNLPISALEPAPWAQSLSPPYDVDFINFYEREFYPLSNFSAFQVKYRGQRFMTSEHAYHFQKFCGCDTSLCVIRQQIKDATSAHQAFKIAETFRDKRDPKWDEVKVKLMKEIITAKAEQHEYVRRKLLETGDKYLVEGSWRDDFWGWGPNKDGQNMLGKLWMEVRDELRRMGRTEGPESPNEQQTTEAL